MYKHNPAGCSGCLPSETSSYASATSNKFTDTQAALLTSTCSSPTSKKPLQSQTEMPIAAASDSMSKISVWSEATSKGITGTQAALVSSAVSQPRSDTGVYPTLVKDSDVIGCSHMAKGSSISTSFLHRAASPDTDVAHLHSSG